MRGKVGLAALADGHAGITPAYAGKRCRHCPRRSRTQDHPRVCGEKNPGVKDPETGEGSPPRMRGKGLRQQIIADGHGITPAYAGKSPLCFTQQRASRDHPRVCGEKT